MVLGLWDFLFLGSRETLIQSQNQTLQEFLYIASS